MAEQYVVIGTSPFYDRSVGLGPFRSVSRAVVEADELAIKGWLIEVVLLRKPDEIGDMNVSVLDA